MKESGAEATPGHANPIRCMVIPASVGKSAADEFVRGRRPTDYQLELGSADLLPIS